MSIRLPITFESCSAANAPSSPPRGPGVLLVDELNRLWSPDGTGGHALIATIGGGGATAFTALTDAPASYSGSGQRGVYVNEAGTGLAFKEEMLVTGTGEVVIESSANQNLTLQNAGSGVVWMKQAGSGTAKITANGGGVSIQDAAASGSIDLTAVTMTLSPKNLRVFVAAAGSLSIEGPVIGVASGPNGTKMTVGGVEYSVAKHLKIENDNGVYFLPVFGPV